MKNTTLKILLTLVIAVALNIIFSFFTVRLDFTGDKRYTLSNASRNILKNLNKEVVITGYFTDNLPPQIAKVRSDFEELVAEYGSLSHGKVTYKSENPNKTPEDEQKAQQAGIQPRVVQVRESDQFKEQRVYMGAKLTYDNQTETIAALEPGAAMEYALSSAIKKMSATNKSKIGLVTGHHEASLRSLMQANQALSVSYQLEPITLADSTHYDNYKTLAIVAPTDSFSVAEIAQLDKFLASGKNILVALNPVKANLQASQGEAQTTGLETWLATKGIDIKPNFVIDAQCAPITVQQQNGFMTFNQQIAFPYLPLIKRFADHPVVKGIEQVMMPFAGAIGIKPTNGIKITALALTSEHSGIEPSPLTFDVNKQLPQYNYNSPNMAVAVAAEGNLSGGSTPAKMIVYADADFALNGDGQQPQQQQPDNINLLVNGIDWLSDDSGLSELRTKGVSSRPIRTDLSEATKLFVKFGNFLLPLILVVAYGFFRYLSRKNKKLRWAAERYN